MEASTLKCSRVKRDKTLHQAALPPLKIQLKDGNGPLSPSPCEHP